MGGVARAAGVSGALRAVPAGRLGRPSAAPIAGVTRAAGVSAGIRAGVSAGVRAGVSAGVRGVDLNLDEFSLAAPKRVTTEASAGVAIGNEFWSNIEGSESIFAKKDKKLLNDVFNLTLSDRRVEGDRFLPPNTSNSYMQQLGCLLKQEVEVQQQRTDVFFGKNFDATNPGTLFPSSWASSIEIARGQAPVKGSALVACPDADADHVLESAPVFDKKAEDGTRFFIFRQDGLEVRTIDEMVGAVFSISTPAAEEHENLVKVTEYVEIADDASSTLNNHSYIVFETEQRNMIVTEMLKDGTLTWHQNPTDLASRNSNAKVIRWADATVTVRDMTRFQATACFPKSKRYAQAIYNAARGEDEVDSGFWQAESGQWRITA